MSRQDITLGLCKSIFYDFRLMKFVRILQWCPGHEHLLVVVGVRMTEMLCSSGQLGKSV